MFRFLTILLVLLSSCVGYSQENQKGDTFSLVFMGDIMGHDAQIHAAYDAQTNTYNYDSVFEKVSPIIQSADVAIANLEVTLAGKPFKGYPQFSSPDALAIAAKKSGIDVLVTANNHSCDRGKQGILRTLKVLDSLEIKHTGTFQDSIARGANNLLILQKNGIKVGLLNYTYGTNGIPAPPPTVVNMLDKEQMTADIKKAKTKQLDKLIVVLHWGIEYKRHPNKKQEELAKFLFENGVDVIIGSHPHVIQRLDYQPATETEKERFIAYSLGNFVSNQRAKTKDGGIIVALTFTKDKNKKVNITEKGYYLLPCATSEAQKFNGLDDFSKKKMQYFMTDSRKLLNSVNTNVFELKE